MSASVAPLVGAWVETVGSVGISGGKRSRPSWARGLKLTTMTLIPFALFVAPLVGAWVETSTTSSTGSTSGRAPRGRVG